VERQNREKQEEFFGYEQFRDLDDSVVAIMANSGNDLAEEYLLNKYKNFVRAKARSYFLIGADKEDLVQEGMIGLYKAIRDFRENKQSSFRAFAELCIVRQIITAIKTATRQKHKPLNSYVSFNKPIYEDESDTTLIDVMIGSKVLNPEEIMIDQEDLESVQTRIGEILSSMEKKVLSLYLDGRSYQEIAEQLNTGTKSIDNALQRVKKKLEKYLNQEEPEAKKGKTTAKKRGSD